MTVAEAITNLQAALEPVTREAPITGAQAAEQVARYVAAHEQLMLALEAERKAAPGPRPEFVRAVEK